MQVRIIQIKISGSSLQGGNKLCLVHQVEENVTSGPVGETMHQS